MQVEDLFDNLLQEMKKDLLLMDFTDLQLELIDLCLHGPLHLLHVCAFPLQGSLIQLSPLV